MVSALPLNFISRNHIFYIIFRLKNDKNGPAFGSPNRLYNSPKINDVVKSAQKGYTLEFLLKIDISEPRARSTLAPIYDKTFVTTFPC